MTPDTTRADAAARLPERIAFLGFGLIGGSIAAALREASCASRLAAWTPAGRGSAIGIERGLLDEASASAPAALDGAGLVVLAGPPLGVIQVIEDLGGDLRRHVGPDTTVTDVASTKARIVAAAAATDLRFVGGHPMAGRETSGAGAATADLFVDRPWVVVAGPRSSRNDVDRVDALALAVGARPVRMDAEAHDSTVAAISHLPLVLAAALVESVAGSPAGAPSWPDARRLAASGWSDMTRLARGDPEMGAGILATNAEAIAKRLRTLREVLDGWLQLLETGAGSDAGALRIKLEQARTALEREQGR